jgi:hypothetical protein
MVKIVINTDAMMRQANQLFHISALEEKSWRDRVFTRDRSRVDGVAAAAGLTVVTVTWVVPFRGCFRYTWPWADRMKGSSFLL